VKKNKYNFLIFFINPFIGAISSLFYHQNKKNFNSFLWLFFSFLFGFFYIPVSENSDYYTYFDRFEVVSKFNLNEFISFLKDQIDYVSWLVLYLFSLIDVSFNLVWGLISLIYGFLVLKIIGNIKKYYELNNITFTIFKKVLLLAFIFVSSLYLIYNFRFWTGTLFIFLGITYIPTGNSKKMLLSFLIASLFHFALIPSVIVFLMAKYIRINLYILAVLCICTLFFDFTDILIEYITNIFEQNLGARVSYISDNYVESYNEHLNSINFYVYGFEKILYYTILFTIILNLRKINLNASKFEKIFISIILLYYILINSLFNFPLSERFVKIAVGVGLLSLLYIPFKFKIKYHKLLYVTCFLFILVECRKYFDSLNLGLFLPTGISSFFLDNISLFDAIF
jgi:hypothetical protein